VREVLVRDGQHVRAGDAVLILGDVRVDADRNRLDYRVHLERAAMARLDAEQSVASTLRFPADLGQAAKQDPVPDAGARQRIRALAQQGCRRLHGEFPRAVVHAITAAMLRHDASQRATRGHLAQGIRGIALPADRAQGFRRCRLSHPAILDVMAATRGFGGAFACCARRIHATHINIHA